MRRITSGLGGGMVVDRAQSPVSSESHSDVRGTGGSLSLMAFSLAIVVVGFIVGHFIVIWVGFFLVVLALLSERMAALTFRRLRLRHQFQSIAADVDQPMNAELIVENPLPWAIGQIAWELDVPEPLRFHSLAQSSAEEDHGQWRIRGTLIVAPKERLRVLFELRGMRRGRFRVGTTAVEFSDPLHWSRWVRRAHLNEKLITIWPKRFVLPVGFWSDKPNLGERRGLPWDPPDPVLIAGIRPYRNGEPVRRIHAYASARTGQLMVKEDEPMVQRTIEVILHPQSTPHAWRGIDSVAMEDSISLAATVVEASLAAGLDVGLTVSGAVSGHPQGVSLRPQHAPGTLAQMLTALAWTEPSEEMADCLIEHLMELSRRASRETVVVLVATFWPLKATAAWAILKQRGVHAIWITNARTYGDPLTPRPSGVRTVWHWVDGEWARE